jgi:spore coat protein H
MELFLKNYLILLFFPVLLLSCDSPTDNNPANNIKTIHTLGVYISDEDYSMLLENRFSNLSVPAEIFLKDKKYTGDIEAQGAGSRYFPKWGYTIRCDSPQSILGLKNFNLTTQVYDKTKIRNTLASYLFRQAGFYVFDSEHLFLKINNENKGLYILVERMDEDFFRKRNLPVYEVVKVGFGAKFTFNEANDLSDSFEKEIPDDKNFSNLTEFIYALDNVDNSNIFKTIGKHLDIEEYLKYHAMTSILNNSDGLTNNFFLYKESPSAPYFILPWDFDKTFDPKTNYGLFGENQIIQQLFQSDSCYNLYISILKNYLNNYFNEENLYPVIDSVYSRIGEPYALDPYLGMSGLSLDSEVSTLKNFISERRKYLLSLLSN